MKKTTLVILALLAVSAITPPVYSLPYWLKEGAYIKYAMKMPHNPEKNEVNIFMIWPRLLPKDAYKEVKELYEGDSGLFKIDNRTMISLFVTGDSYLTFEILNVTNETAFVKVTLEMNNVSIGPDEILPRLVLSKILILNLSDMMYYEEDGTPIGPPMFFIDPAHPPRKEDYLLAPAFLKKYNLRSDDIVVTNVSFTWMEDKILHTHYRDFIPPYLFVESRGAYIIHDLKTGSGHVITTELIYEPDTGLLITTLLVEMAPETTSLGVIGAIALDMVNSRKLERLIEEGKDDKEWWAQGFNLYDTNVKLPDYGSGRSPSTPVKYFFAFSLVVLAMIALWTERRWKR
ncbi:hypothetical protein [Thermococcus aciditolerans]|uniref:DUF3068 domain-containing protein n=1 Tax=Thermococcus aciditolerans TaxID=2598455 RepID=A0A5C0SNE5_9EURY|nr:hypothetical protein [Thermococcus aciditolerans]QEK15307.1 hypothetical protein FPV09_09615 [Thermococcus aciditolerans]